MKRAIYTLCFILFVISMLCGKAEAEKAITGRLGIVRYDKTVIYRKADSKSTPLYVCGKNTMVGLVAQTNHYYAVLMLDSTLGFVEKSHVKLSEMVSLDTPSPTIRKLLNTVMGYIGIPYSSADITGGTRINNSLFIQQVFAHVGVNLPCDLQDQWKSGKPIAWSNLKAGDRLYFSINDTTINHAGIYLGGDMFIHVSSQGVVKMNNLTDPFYYRNIAGARRDVFPALKKENEERWPVKLEKIKKYIDEVCAKEDAVKQTTVADWKTWDDNKRTNWTSGLYTGNVIGSVLVGGSDAILARQKKRLYLLNGWRMMPTAYALEVDALLKNDTRNRKSITANYIKAEAAFARAAGQDGRANHLFEEAKMLEGIVAKITEKNSIFDPELDGSEMWHTMQGLGVTDYYTKGILDGIAYSRSAINAEIGCMNFHFRVGQLEEAMNAEVNQANDDKLLLSLALQAEMKLLQQAATP